MHPAARDGRQDVIALKGMAVFFNKRLNSYSTRSNNVISPGPAGLMVLAATLAMTLPACADAHNNQAIERTISVTGSGEASGSPDRAQISVGVQTVAATVVDASRANQTIVERIADALEKHGIDDEDIQTSNYSIWPRQQHDPRQSGDVKITGYQVSNTVSITVHDIDSVGEILAAVTNAGANSVHGISFAVKDKDALEQQARKMAMDDARARAESLAGLAGVELGEVLTISTSSGGGYPSPVMAQRNMSMESAPAPGISPGQLNVSVQVHATFAIQ